MSMGNTTTATEDAAIYEDQSVPPWILLATIVAPLFGLAVSVALLIQAAVASEDVMSPLCLSIATGGWAYTHLQWWSTARKVRKLSVG